MQRRQPAQLPLRRLLGAFLLLSLAAQAASELPAEAIQKNRLLQAAWKGDVTLPVEKTSTAAAQGGLGLRQRKLRAAAEAGEAWARKALWVEAELARLQRAQTKGYRRPPVEVGDGPIYHPAGKHYAGSACDNALTLGHDNPSLIALASAGRAGDRVWLRWQAPSAGVYQFSSVGSTIDSRLTAYPSCAPQAKATAANDDAFGLAAIVGVEASHGGQTFYLLAENLAVAGSLAIKGSAAASIRGRVTDAATGQPIAGVQIHAQSKEHYYSLGYASTDSSGNYLLTADFWDDRVEAIVRTGDSGQPVPFVHEAWNDKPCADRDSYGFEACQPPDSFELTPGATVENIDFALAATAQLSGRVVDAGSGDLTIEPVELFLYSAGLPIAYANTDTSGRFRMTHLPPGRFTLVARSSAYQTAIYPNLPCEQFPACVSAAEPAIELRHGELQSVEMRLAPMSFIEFALSLDGVAVTDRLWNLDARVYRPNGTRVEADWHQDAADPSRFRVGPLLTGRYRLAVAWPGVSFARLYPAIDCSANCELELDLGQYIEIASIGDRPSVGMDVRGLPAVAGRVTDANGAPIADAQVTAHSVQGYDYSVPWATTDQDGRYLFPRISSGRRLLHVKAPRYIDQAYPGIACEAPNPAQDCPNAESIQVGLHSPPRIEADFALDASPSIHGRLLQDGQPLPAGADTYADTLRLLSRERYPLAGTGISFDPETSRYELFDYPPGRYYLRAAVRGYFLQVWPLARCAGGYWNELEQCDLSAAETIELGSGGPFDFELEQSGARTVLVRDEASLQPLADVTVDVWNQDGHLVSSTRSDRLGRAVVSRDGYWGESFRISTDNYSGYADEVYDNRACPAGTSVFKGGCTLVGALEIALPNQQPNAPPIRFDLHRPPQRLVFSDGFE